MSTKVYEAYRVISGIDPIDLMISLKQEGCANAKRLTREFYQRILDSPVKATIVRMDLGIAYTAALSVFDVDRWVLLRYREQLGSSQRNEFHFDASITLRKHRDRFYLIPYADRVSELRGCLDFLKSDPRLEDFSYWNNSDGPDEVSEDQWEERASVWKALTPHDRWQDFITVDIVSYEGWSMTISPVLDLIQQRVEAMT